MNIDIKNKKITLPAGITVGTFLDYLEHVKDLEDFVIDQELPINSPSVWTPDDRGLWKWTDSPSNNSACEGCEQYERIKRGETVICHCSVPSRNITF